MPGEFLDHEIHDIAAAVSLKHDAGRVHRPRRECGEGYDRVIVPVVGRAAAHYRLERDLNGMTHVLLCTEAEWKVLASGTLQQCLQIFRRL